MLEPIQKFFRMKGFKPLPFQKQAWNSYLQKKDGLIIVPTGFGKTYAAFMGPFADLIAKPTRGLAILYITPLRSLGRDIEKSLNEPIRLLNLPIKIQSRTGDSSSSVKMKQLKQMPQVLVTTPESLSVLLSYPQSHDLFSELKCVIVDEWHELLSSKRGTQTELCLARLRNFNAQFSTWGLSATLDNPQQAAEALTGKNSAVLIQPPIEKKIEIDCLLPQEMDSFPYAGHLGLSLAEDLVERINVNTSTLIFTNTKFQAEKWFETLLALRPEWEGILALHHGSLSREDRESIEEAAKNGDVKIIVCTSSLDLGVDFSPVENVVQIGSTKGVSRLIQRAGRSAHSPGMTSKILFVPTHAIEILEVNALRKAFSEKIVEPRWPLEKPYDVLIQHMVTCALGGGFRPDPFFKEVRSALAYRNLSRKEFDELLHFLVSGGHSLQAYPQYQKISLNDGVYEIRHALIGKLHRLNMGTIVSNSMVKIAFQARGKSLGQIEEIFAAKLKPGDVFTFGGRTVEFIRLHDMTALVKPSKSTRSNIPAWAGSRMPLSVQLASEFRESLKTQNFLNEAEKQKIRVILEDQIRLSQIPSLNEILIENFVSREGHHVFLFPFEGRNVHEGLAALFSKKISDQTKVTLSTAVNDYGIEILAPKDFDFSAFLTAEFFKNELFSSDHLQDELKSAINTSEMSKRQFRGISQIAGLIFQGYPGQSKSAKQVQISSSLIYDVFRKYEPHHLLLVQAEREALEHHMENERLKTTLRRLHDQTLIFKTTSRPSPLAFPLIVERLNSRVSSESLIERVERMKKIWSKKSK